MIHERGWYSKGRKRIWEQCRVTGTKTDIHNAAMMLRSHFEYSWLSKAQIKRYRKVAAVRDSIDFGEVNYGWRRKTNLGIRR